MITNTQFSGAKMAHKALKLRLKKEGALLETPLINTVIKQLEDILSSYTPDWPTTDLYLTESERKTARSISRMWIQKSRQSAGLQDITNFVRR